MYVHHTLPQNGANRKDVPCMTNRTRLRHERCGSMRTEALAHRTKEHVEHCFALRFPNRRSGLRVARGKELRQVARKARASTRIAVRTTATRHARAKACGGRYRSHRDSLGWACVTSPTASANAARRRECTQEFCACAAALSRANVRKRLCLQSDRRDTKPAHC